MLNMYMASSYSKPRLVFYKNALVVLENMINYHYQPDDEYLDNIEVLIKSFSLIGMQEYGQELATFVEKINGEFAIFNLNLFSLIY
jgi:hypothetical protein